MHSVAYVATLTQDCSSMPPLPDCYRLHHKYPAACPSCLLWHAEMSIGTILSMWLIVQVQRAHQAVYCRNNVMLFWVKIGMALLKPGMGSFPHKHCLFCYAATFNATIKLFFHVFFFFNRLSVATVLFFWSHRNECDISSLISCQFMSCWKCSPVCS